MYDDRKERQEAIEAGERALASLQTARDVLKSARGWGIVDMLSRDSMMLTFIKRSKMERARQNIEQAKYDLRTFSRELGDVQGFDSMNLQMGDFLGFADYFFDNLIVDWMVQSRINEAGRQVDDAINRVEAILARL